MNRHRLEDAHCTALLAIAADAIGRGLRGSPRELPEPSADPALSRPGAAFVTLQRGDALLGCIGSLVPSEPLCVNVARNAWNAAFADPRLPSLTEDEYVDMSIAISVLSPLTSVRARSWRDVHRHVHPGVDGLLVEAGRHRATLLPSMWAKLSDREEFLDVLWHKAGLRARDWLPGMRVRRYTTHEFHDAGPRAPLRTG